jgi:hypothetical protein
MKVDNLYIVMFPSKSDIQKGAGEVYTSGDSLFAKYSLKCKSTETYVVKTLGGRGPSTRGDVVKNFVSGAMPDSFSCERRPNCCSGGFVEGGSVGVYAVFHCDLESRPVLFDALQSGLNAKKMDQDKTAQAFVRVLYDNVGIARMDKLVLVACNSAHHAVQGSMSFLDRVCAVLGKDGNPPCIVGWDGFEFVSGKDGSKTDGSGSTGRSEQRSERKWIATYVPGMGYQQKRYEPQGWSADQHVQTNIGPACIPL